MQAFFQLNLYQFHSRLQFIISRLAKYSKEINLSKYLGQRIWEPSIDFSLSYDYINFNVFEGFVSLYLRLLYFLIIMNHLAFRLETSWQLLENLNPIFYSKYWQQSPNGDKFKAKNFLVHPAALYGNAQSW